MGLVEPRTQNRVPFVIPPFGAERFEASDFLFYVVGFQVQVHALLGRLYVIDFLKKDSYVESGKRRRRKMCLLISGIGSSAASSAADQKRDALIEVRDVDDEVCNAATLQ